MKLENIGLGIDVENVERFKKYAEKDNPFINRIFTKKEIEYSYKTKNFAQHLCARYCAKEACVKALYSLGVDGYFCRDFEVENLPSGVPQINLIGPKRGDNLTFKLSLSHTDTFAAATVIVLIN